MPLSRQEREEFLAEPHIAALSVAGRYRVDSAFADVTLGATFHDGCENAPIDGQWITDEMPAADVWHTIALDDATVPATATHVLFSVESFSTATYQLLQDRLYVGAGSPVFRDDFEADFEGASAPCRWASLP